MKKIFSPTLLLFLLGCNDTTTPPEETQNFLGSGIPYCQQTFAQQLSINGPIKFVRTIQEMKAKNVNGTYKPILEDEYWIYEARFAPSGFLKYMGSIKKQADTDEETLTKHYEATNKNGKIRGLHYYDDSKYGSTFMGIMTSFECINDSTVAQSTYKVNSEDTALVDYEITTMIVNANKFTEYKKTYTIKNKKITDSIETRLTGIAEGNKRIYKNLTPSQKTGTTGRMFIELESDSFNNPTKSLIITTYENGTTDTTIQQRSYTYYE